MAYYGIPVQASFKWDPPLDTIKAKTNAAIRAHGLLAIQRVAEQMISRIRDWMKANAKWKDRTGDARRTLNAWAVNMSYGALVVLSHGVPYGIYLETMQAGRFAILKPALNYWAPRFIEAMRTYIQGNKAFRG